LLSRGNKKPTQSSGRKQIFEFIVSLGWAEFSLTPNSLLSWEEKAIVTLIAAAYSNAALVVFNFPEYAFNKILCEAIAGIAALMRTKEKALILGTGTSDLIEKACTHTAILKEGKTVYCGTVEAFRRYDKIHLIIRDKNIETIRKKLAVLLPQYGLFIKDDSLMLSSFAELKQDELWFIYQKILQTGFIPAEILLNPKTVRNAYEEFVKITLIL
jgi:ABC-2 type transport system ATP-binding protein